jgi:hypothetical protein
MVILLNIEVFVDLGLELCYTVIAPIESARNRHGGG